MTSGPHPDLPPVTPDAFETLAPLWRRAQSGDEAAYRDALRLMAGRVRGFLRAKVRVVAHIETIKRGFAALLGLMGVAILAGWDKALEARIVAWLPTSWVDLTVMC